MTIWAIADLHLSFGVPNKEMDVFGEQWENHPAKVKEHWLNLIDEEDLVLLAGDFSWAKKIEEAVPDFQWLHELPGTKAMIKGNHDYWWRSLSKAEEILPSSVHLIQNNTFSWKDVEIGGTRLWDADFSFDEYIEFRENPNANISERQRDEKENEKIYQRELNRLELSLNSFQSQSSLKIAMTHYPPVDAELHPSEASNLLEKYGIKECIFGHLHNVRPGTLPYGERNGVNYHLTSCDYLDFIPKKILH